MSQTAWNKWPDIRHPSHDTRISDASTYDEVCVNCGAHDITGGGWGFLRAPCEEVKQMEKVAQMENADNWRDASPWWPMQDALDLAHLTKLTEELGEATSATARCLMQGILEPHPVTGKINREWLEDELADVRACDALCVERFGLDEARMKTRTERKLMHLRGWHEHIRTMQAAERDRALVGRDDR